MTALNVFALAGDWRRQRLILRLTTLVTARYNWRLDELSIARSEIAQLWSVDERTVKRELARLREIGFLYVKRRGARGRATTYALGMEALWSSTLEFWPRIGSDFVARRSSESEAHPSGTASAGMVVPFPITGADLEEAPGAPIWSRMRVLLKTWNAARYGRWLQPLVSEQDCYELRLRAPSAFHATYIEQKFMGDLEAAAAACGAPDIRIRVAAA